jgi:hypothetical protein
VRALKDGFDRGAFGEEETRLLDALDAEWRLRAWCAKEAAAKALGTGLLGKPKDLVTRKIDESSGMIAVEVSGDPAKARPALAGTILDVRTLREGDLVAAITTCNRKAPTSPEE